MSLIQGVRNVVERLLQATRVRGLPDKFLERVTADEGTIERIIERLMEDYFQPSVIMGRFSGPVQTEAGEVEKQFVDLDFSQWLWDPSAREIMREAMRKGFRRPNQAEAMRSLEIRRSAADGRDVALFVDDPSKEQDLDCVRCLMSNSSGVQLSCVGMNHVMRRECGFRFVEDHGYLQSWMRILG